MVADLNRTVGALLIGVLLTSIGFGITTTQTYMYANRFPRDPWYIKFTVFCLFTLDIAHIGFAWHMVYFYLVINFNNTSALEEAVWSFAATIILTAIITVIVHGFYARRIFILGGRKLYLPALILVLSLVRLVFGCIACAQIIHLKTFHRVQHETSTVVVGLSAGTLADCVITASLVHFLRAHRAEFNPSLNSILDRITYWTVNNGLLTSLVGIAFLITQFSPLAFNMIFIALHLLLSKLYANSLLATLNFREPQRSGRAFDAAASTSALSMSNVSRAQWLAPRQGTGLPPMVFSRRRPSRAVAGENIVSAHPAVHLMAATAAPDALYDVDDLEKPAQVFPLERLGYDFGHVYSSERPVLGIRHPTA